jgi:hypothetical protein
MKKIMVILITLCFLAGCTPGVTVDSTNYCYNCHYNSCGNVAVEREYRTHLCANCHKVDICETGNDWKSRELNKLKKKSKPSKKKSKRMFRND